MPNPSPATPGPRLTRRAALGAAVATVTGGLAACTPERGIRRRDGAPPPVEPEVDPDVAVATEALAAQTALIDLVRATQERHGRLSEALAPVLEAHEAHAALLSEAVPPTESGSPAPSASASPSPTTSGERRTRVPRNRARALQQVVTAEQALATSTKRHAFKAQSGAFARVLGSMAAAAAQHAVVLRSVPTGRPS